MLFLFHSLSIQAARLNQGCELCAVIDYAPLTLLSQDSEDSSDPHPNLNLLLAGYDLAGDLGPFVQLDYGQIVGSEPLEVVSGIVDGGVGDDGPGALEGMALQVSAPSAVGAEVSGGKKYSLQLLQCVPKRLYLCGMLRQNLGAWVVIFTS